MSLINVISVPTANGIKTIEIHNDDLTRLNWNFDILVISAFHNKYNPRPNTVIKSLEDDLGLVVENFASSPLIDLRSSLNCWISRTISGINFKHILCIEGIKTAIKESGTSESVLSDLFGTISLLPYKGIQANSIAMPIIGAGFQGNSVELILPKLIEKAIESLSINSTLNIIYFVEIDETKAKLIDDTINTTLKRDKEKLEIVFEDPLVIDLLENFLIKLIQIQKINKKFENNKTFKNLIEKINNRELRFFELGILCRKLMELLIPEISKLKSDKFISLYEHVNELKSKNIADWMLTYLHTLRIFGNFVAHEDESNGIPDRMEKTDMIVFSHALNRFLDFYISFNQSTIHQSKK
jgi:hypothetical protein